MSTYFVNGDTMTGIADAIRFKTDTTDTMLPSEMIDKINGITYGCNISISNHMVGGKWVRPSEYPDLDSITIPSDFDGMYLTYDLRKTPGYGWIGLYIQIESSSGKYYVERGHLENGVFVADETYEQARNSYFRQALDETYGDVQLWRVTGVGHILRKGFCPSTASSSTAIFNQLQPCVECVGRLDYLNNLVGTVRSRSSIAQSTLWMEHEAIKISGEKNITVLSNVWRGCYSLQSLEIGDWPVDKWAITTIEGTFCDCISLQHLDIENWDVSNWAVTTMANTFQNCHSLLSLDLSKWDVSNWRPTTITYCWGYCYSLKNLNIANWDVSDWPLTTFSYVWYCNYNLKNLDISDWDVSDWELTTIHGAFGYMFSLQTLDLSSWDISNWNLDHAGALFVDVKSLSTLLLPDGAFQNVSTDVCPSTQLTNYNGVITTNSHSYENCYLLTPQSIKNILNKLPTITSSATLTLGQHNRLKVLSTDIAVATQKGWTVA